MKTPSRLGNKVVVQEQFGSDVVEVTLIPIRENRYYLAFEVNGSCLPEDACASNKVSITRWLLQLWKELCIDSTYVVQPVSDYQTAIYEKLGFNFANGNVFMEYNP